MQQTLSEEIKGRRLMLGTQAAAAQKCGVSLRYIQKLEASDAAPSQTFMLLLRSLTPKYKPSAAGQQEGRRYRKATANG